MYDAYTKHEMCVAQEMQVQCIYGARHTNFIKQDVAAMLKSAQPDWFPADIKSALMTTPDTLNLVNNPILDERLCPADLYVIDAGHVNPSRENDPELIYDALLRITYRIFVIWTTQINR